MIIRRFFGTIPKAVREQVWLRANGPQFSCKCNVSWCENDINVFDFTVGHNIPSSKGGSDKLYNLRPICARCNSGMGNMYTIDEWESKFN